MEEVKKGLENVIALETGICFIDGLKGVLEYRGLDINELLDYPYEAVSYLLVRGRLPDEGELAAYSGLLKEKRVLGEDVLDVARTCNFNIEAMDALRTTVSYMSHCDPDLNAFSPEANLRKADSLIAAFPTIIAAFHRITQGKTPISPDPALSHGANFLYMLRGERPDELEARAVEQDFILSAEHELNASTFSSRVAASTLSDLHSAIISGICTLKGPLHGGARMKTMQMLDEIPSPAGAEAYVLEKIEKKDVIMGFGHRVYKTHDPRGKALKTLAKELAEAKSRPDWYETAEIVERTVQRELVEKKNKSIYPNMDLYGGVVYKYLELPPELATAAFAAGRVSGWVAHCLEQYGDNRLIRPRARYVDPPEEVEAGAGIGVFH